MLSAHDVVRELRRRLPDAGDLKIHKLVYYCQGWHLAWTGAPMFGEAIEAGTHGPVVADLWHDERGQRQLPPAQQLGDQQLAVLDYVITRYGDYTGQQLAKMTHDESPWRDVSESEDTFGVASPEITCDAIADFFERDAELEVHKAEVARLRKRRDVYGFGEPAMPEGLREATLKILAEGA